MEGLNTSVIIDTGSGFTKAGFVGDDAPRERFPTVIGYEKDKNKTMTAGRPYCGEVAVTKGKGILNLYWPVNRGVFGEWEHLEGFWHDTFLNKLKVPAAENQTVITDAPLNSAENREKIAQVMFERFNVPGLYLANQGVMAAYGAGRTTCLVCLSGAGATYLVPVKDGVSIREATVKLELGG